MSLLAWVVLIVLLVAVFGLGSVLEAAFWLLLVLALAVAVVVFLVARAVRERV